GHQGCPAAERGRGGSCPRDASSTASGRSGGHMAASGIRVFGGTSNPDLARGIAAYLELSLGAIDVFRFADGEIGVRIEESVRGEDVFIVQPTCPPASETLMELLVII